MKEKSWGCTLFTQISLCLAVYLALYVGQPQKPLYGNRNYTSSPLDVYFISVVGGSRHHEEQALLLKQMEKAVVEHRAQFVVNVSELGEDDPLTQNATSLFQSLNVPWYTTRASKAQKPHYYSKQISIPYRKTLDIIAVNTGSRQDPLGGNGDDQLEWLTRILEESNSDWSIVVGFHPLLSCDGNIGKTGHGFESLHHILLKYGVDGYLSQHACFNYTYKGDTVNLSNAVPISRGPYLTPISQKLQQKKEKAYGLLLHRVSAIEIGTYLVTYKGEVIHRMTLQQQGRHAM